jgi:hypothetical protein
LALEISNHCWQIDTPIGKQNCVSGYEKASQYDNFGGHILTFVPSKCSFGSEEPPDCNTTAAESTRTIETSFVIFGMILLGFLADWIGRKWGSRLTITFMVIGGIILSSATGSAQAFLTVFYIGICLYSLGVGGEFPLSSCSAMERAEGDPKVRHRRGEVVVLTFTQQGWGIWANTLVRKYVFLTFLLTVHAFDDCEALKSISLQLIFCCR